MKIIYKLTVLINDMSNDVPIQQEDIDMLLEVIEYIKTIEAEKAHLARDLAAAWKLARKEQTPK